MDESQAREILGDSIVAGGLDYSPKLGYVSWESNREDVDIEGWFTPEQLEAIAWWMRNKK